MTIQLNFDPEELAYLLDEKIDSHPVKHLISEVQRVQHVKSAQTKALAIDETKSNEDVAEKVSEEPESDPQQQRSLFEY
jgi:hypothetical protein